MKEFEKRRDRFDFFNAFEKPLLNVCFELEVEDFRDACKKKNIPVSDFFLYNLFMALNEMDNFKYRIFEGRVIKIERFIGSSTVLNEDELFNYTRFEVTEDLQEFLKNSAESKKVSQNSLSLMNVGQDLPSRELKDYVFITSLPWLRFTSIEHPVQTFKSADIPSFAWGKFTENQGKLLVPFSVQAHHGFVDGVHVYRLGEKIKERIVHSLNYV